MGGLCETHGLPEEPQPLRLGEKVFWALFLLVAAIEALT